MREARAAAARAPALVPRARIESRARFARWPAHLLEPRRRLVRGPIWLGAWTLCVAGFGPLAIALIGTHLASEALEICRALRPAPLSRVESCRTTASHRAGLIGLTHSGAHSVRSDMTLME
jgi:hypothetical protein